MVEEMFFLLLTARVAPQGLHGSQSRPALGGNESLEVLADLRVHLLESRQFVQE